MWDPIPVIRFQGDNSPRPPDRLVKRGRVLGHGTYHLTSLNILFRLNILPCLRILSSLNILASLSIPPNIRLLHSIRILHNVNIKHTLASIQTTLRPHLHMPLVTTPESEAISPAELLHNSRLLALRDPPARSATSEPESIFSSTKDPRAGVTMLQSRRRVISILEAPNTRRYLALSLYLLPLLRT